MSMRISDVYLSSKTEKNRCRQIRAPIMKTLLGRLHISASSVQATKQREPFEQGAREREDYLGFEDFWEIKHGLHLDLRIFGK